LFKTAALDLRRTTMNPLKNLVDYNRQLFIRLDEFFVRATGMSPSEFASVSQFGNVIRGRAAEVAPRSEVAFRWLDAELRPFYRDRAPGAFRDARQLGGMKLVLGGGSRFRQSQLDSVSSSVLCSDTVLIPDPVLPWVETERREERFRHVLLIQAIHALLQLKPLIDADLPCPAVVVFPSWEKALQEHDLQTQEGIHRIVCDVVGDAVGRRFENGFEELVEYADQSPDEFCRAADRGRLFVAPGGALDEPLSQALTRYDKELATWRSQEWLDAYDTFPAHRRVLNGLSERLTPMFHMLENSTEFYGHPLMCLEVHAHYFNLVCKVSAGRLKANGIVDERVSALVNAMCSRRLRWLGKIPADALAGMRRDDDNGKFRQRLASAVARLSESALSDLDRVAAEVCHEIDMAVAEHQRELRAIQAKHARSHAQTAALAVATLGGALMPALAPLLGMAAPVVLAAKYAYDKSNEVSEERARERSLLGVLASARNDGDG
jgi:hypothetical protein